MLGRREKMIFCKSKGFHPSKRYQIEFAFYADDLIIISPSKIGLQNCLNTLSSFCNSWMLDINSKKTKVMVFQKRAKKNSNLEFHIGKETIDIVHEYTYLGTRISSTGNFNISLEHLKEKALHALFSLRKHTNFS